MSILAAAASQPVAPAESGSLAELLILVGIAVVGVVVAWWLGAFRPRTVSGPRRVAPDGDVWPLVVAIAAAIFGLFAGSALGAGVVFAIAARDGSTVDLQNLGQSATLVVSLIGSAAAGFSGLVVLALLQRSTVAGLGLSPRRLLAGLLAGAVGAFVLTPWTLLLGVGVEQFYRAVQFEHPAEHDLLKTMTEADQWVKLLAIVSAVVAAPLLEEFFFRGLLQTALVEMFARTAKRVPAAVDAGGVPVAVGVTPMLPAGVSLPPPPPPPLAGEAFADPPPVEPMPAVPVPAVPPAPVIPLAYEVPAPVVRPPRLLVPPPRPWMSWAAVVLTSALFALVHPLWTAPIIFFLALGLGYVYERTGNLWATITLHALFNSISVVLYLLQVG